MNGKEQIMDRYAVAFVRVDVHPSCSGWSAGTTRGGAVMPDVDAGKIPVTHNVAAGCVR